MAFCEFKFFSRALDKAAAANLILPEPEVEPPFATFYLLHGLSDDHTIWERRTSIERYVAGLPIIVVMPDGGRGFYTDAQQGCRYESAIISDLLPYVDRLFPTRASRPGRCIGGLSMGGYGAIKLALKHPTLFCSAVSHSGALGFAHREYKPGGKDDTWKQEWSRVFGPAPAGGPEDCYALAERLKPGARPALRIDCGAEDFLIEDNRSFIAHLKAVGYAHEYAEYPGAHNWAYWDEHVQEAIRFHCRNLGIDTEHEK